MKKIAMFMLAAVALALGTVRAETLRVDSQQDFDNLTKSIEAAVKGGATIVDVQLPEGTLLFRNRQLSFSNKQWGEVALIIRGDNTTLVPADEALRDTTPPAPLQQTDRLIEVVDEAQKLCRLHLAKGHELADNGQAERRICITQWFKAQTYKVQRVSEGWVYFTADDLSYNSSYKCHSVNLDYGYSLKHGGKGVMPRYRVEGTAQSKGNACRLLSVENCRLASLELNGISVRGNKESSADYLIYMRLSSADSIAVRGCLFQGIRSQVMLAEECRNVRVSDCQFRDCHRGGVQTVSSEGTVVSNNEFVNMGLACKNSFCIRVSGKDYLVAGNSLVDFGYGGIAIGTWWKADKRTEESGIVERNTLSYSADYFSRIAERGLMDGGAIYIYTQNDHAQVRHNYIHDYTGMCDNRGIFCDDGACHFELYGNIVVNTPKGRSIDSRLTPSVATDKQSKTQVINTDNKIYDNIIDSSLRFEGRDSRSGCELGDNIVLVGNKRNPPANTLKNLSRQRNPQIAAYYGMDGDAIVVPAETLRRIAALANARPMLKNFKER